MTSYLVIVSFIIIATICLVDKRIKKLSTVYWITVVIIILTVFAGTRLIGYDYETYAEHFARVPNLMNFQRIDLSIELCYELLVSIIKMFSNSFHTFLLIFVGLSLVLAIRLCVLYSPYPLLSFYMFFSYSFFSQIMGQMRQPIAIIITFLVLIPLLIKKYKLLACLWIFLSGVLLHKSLFFLLPFLFFGNCALTKTQITLLLLLSIGSYILLPTVISNVVNSIPSNFYLSEALLAYLDYRAITITFTLGMVERFFMLLILFYYSSRYNIYSNNSIFRLFSNMYLLGVCLYFSFISVSAEFASRGTQAYTYTLFLALPIIFKYANLKDKYILLGVIITWGLYLSISFLNESPLYIPYKTTLY